MIPCETREGATVRRRLESGLVGMIALACVVFAVVLVRGPAAEEERAMQAWRGWKRWWFGGEEGARTLARDQVLRLPAGREGSWIRVEAGTVVVTREGDPADHVLQAGAELRLPGRGLAVAWALEPSQIEVRAGGEHAAERPAVQRPLSLAR
jgi:hypothetical protein